MGDLLAGRYRLVQSLGSGAMGQVWLAEDELLNRQVAIKQLLLDAAATEPQDVQRAMREARLAGRLTSPYTVRVHDLLLDGGRPSLVMEYVAGQTLAERLLQRGRISVPEAGRFIGQVAEALAEAHELGITHRDVKPANILISAAGRAKLADFGIARSGSEASLTSADAVIGTIAFMAPEVADGSHAGPASDLWSLGATLYRALEGRPPFTGGNAVEVLLRVVRDPVPAPTQAGELTPLIARLLDRDPARRPSALEVADRLRAFDEGRSAHGSGMGAMPPPGPYPGVAVSAPPPGPHQDPELVSAETMRRTPAFFESGSGAVPTPTEATFPKEWGSMPGAAPPAPVVPAGAPVRRGTLLVWLGAALAVLGSVVAIILLVGGGSTSGTVVVSHPTTNTISVIEPGEDEAKIIDVGEDPFWAVAAPSDTPAEGTVYVANTGGGTVSVIEPGDDTDSTVEVGDRPQFLAVAPAGTPNEGTVYVSNAESGTVSVIEPGEDTATTVEVGDSPQFLAVAPAGTRNEGTVYVANAESDTISAIQPGAGSASSISVGDEPVWVAVAPSGTEHAGEVYVSNRASNTVSIIPAEVLATSGEGSSTPLVTTVGVGGEPLFIAVVPAQAPDAGTVYVANTTGSTVSVIRTGESDATTIQVGWKPRFLAVAPAGTPEEGTVYVAGSGSGTIAVIAPGESDATSISAGADPRFLAVAPVDSPDAGTVYFATVGGGDTVGVIEPGASEVSGLEVGADPGFVMVSP